MSRKEPEQLIRMMCRSPYTKRADKEDTVKSTDCKENQEFALSYPLEAVRFNSGTLSRYKHRIVDSLEICISPHQYRHKKYRQKISPKDIAKTYRQNIPPK